ncbi:MAG: hypothetical protein IT449_05170 [Phycisphaerales bacterium]|nr:hypothetical protein [Phycisphaerales bacterium]
MTTTCAHQLVGFASCVFDGADIVEVRRLHEMRRGGISTWHRADELHTLADALASDNARGEQLYIGANPRNRHGGTKAADVALARCVFADFDGVSVEEAHDRIEAARLPAPTLILFSGHGVHAYWRLAEPITDPAFWTHVQRRLAIALDSDPAVKDAPRIMRLPGFLNLKDPSRPVQAEIIEADPSRVCELADIFDHLPEAEEARPQRAAQADATPRSVNTLAAMAKAANYAAKWEPVAQGGRNPAALRHAAQLTRDFALTDDEALPLLRAWNSQNSPPLDEGELLECLHNGRKYGQREYGSKAPPTDSLPAQGPPWWSLDEVVKMPEYRHGLEAVSSGFHRINAILGGGFRRQMTYVLGGRTGGAKSALVANIARRAALDGAPVLYFKLEESIREAVYRLHAITAQVDLRVLLDGIANASADDRAKLLDAWQLLRALPIMVSDRRAIGSIMRIIGEWSKAGGKLVLLDQLSQVETDAEVGFQHATLVSGALRRAACDFNLPIVIVSQVNRPAAANKSKELSAHDLRDSGMLENDPAAVLLIDKARDPTGPQYGPAMKLLQLVVGKNRYGPLTKPGDPIELAWWPESGRVEDVALVEAVA